MTFFDKLAVYFIDIVSNMEYNIKVKLGKLSLRRGETLRNLTSSLLKCYLFWWFLTKRWGNKYDQV